MVLIKWCISKETGKAVSIDKQVRFAEKYVFINQIGFNPHTTCDVGWLKENDSLANFTILLSK